MMTLILTRIWSEEAGQAVLLILFMALLLLAAYYSTRFLTRSMRGSRKGGKLRLLDQLYLGKDKHVALIQLGDKGYLVGISGQTVSALDKLDQSELAQLLEDQAKSPAAAKKPPWLDGAGQVFKDFFSAPQKLRQAHKQQTGGRQPDPDELDQLIKAVQDKSSKIRAGRQDGGSQE